jgi:hypothetical protein
MKKIAQEDSVENVVDKIQASLTDHDVGWANIESAPVLFHAKDAEKAHRGFMVISVQSYHPTTKRFKITVEEV